MNDISQYLAVRDQMRAGDLIVLWGTAPISFAIEAFAPGASHVALVRQPFWHGIDVQIIESTISRKFNGVQTNFLGETLANYGDGSSASWLQLSEEKRARINWQKFYEACGALDGHVSYDKIGLFEYILRGIPVIGPRIAQREHSTTMVCSALGEAIWEESGLLSGINHSKVTPEDLIEMRLYAKAVPILGRPKLSKRFNTV